MSRRVRSCVSCSGKTRHDDRRCARCRRRRAPAWSFVLLPTIADPMAPTVADLEAGIDITGYLA